MAQKRTFGRQNYCPFLCKDGTSSPSLLPAARSKDLALSPYQAQPNKASRPSGPRICELPRKYSRFPSNTDIGYRKAAPSSGAQEPTPCTLLPLLYKGRLLLLARPPASHRRGFPLVTREREAPIPYTNRFCPQLM